MIKYYTYETKCRRCGELYEWTDIKKSLVKWNDFAEVMSDYIQSPRLMYCKKCLKATIQDIVSYNEFER